MDRGLVSNAFTELSQANSHVVREPVGISPDLHGPPGSAREARAMTSMSETAQFLAGASFGLAVVFAALLASTASMRAGESWAACHRVRATAFASFAGVSAFTAVAGVVYGLALVVSSSPLTG